jgi:2'-5' RNA ligase
MRLSTGLDLPAAVTAALGRLQDRLRPLARIHWSPVENLHITLKFIGEWPEERLGELRQALAQAPPRTPFPVGIRGLGFFPNARSPRIFWCGIESPPLAALARDVEDACAALGIAREDRAYSPHLTLARIKERLDLQPLLGAIEELPSTAFGHFEAGSFFLYRSQLSRSGSVYTKLAEYPFQPR